MDGLAGCWLVGLWIYFLVGCWLGMGGKVEGGARWHAPTPGPRGHVTQPGPKFDGHPLPWGLEPPPTLGYRVLPLP